MNSFEVDLKKRIFIISILISITIIAGVLIVALQNKSIQKFSHWDELYGGKLFNVPVWVVYGEVRFESVKDNSSWSVTNVSGENKYTISLSKELMYSVPEKGQMIQFSGKVMHLGSGGFIYDVIELKLLH
jgi:hypothetical protein